MRGADMNYRKTSTLFDTPSIVQCVFSHRKHTRHHDGNKKIMRLMFEYGAEINKVYTFNFEKYTALHKIVDARCIECTNMLLSYGADVNIRGANGKTPLHGALLSSECTLALLYAKADPNSICDLGITPLHQACVMRQRANLEHHIIDPCIQALLSAGADYTRPFIDDDSNVLRDNLWVVINEMGGEEGVRKARLEFEQTRTGYNSMQIAVVGVCVGFLFLVVVVFFFLK